MRRSSVAPVTSHKCTRNHPSKCAQEKPLPLLSFKTPSLQGSEKPFVSALATMKNGCVFCWVGLFVYYSNPWFFVPRFLRVSHVMGLLVGANVNDVIYCALPLYHTSGCILSVGGVFATGYTLVVRRKFSASRFWDECIQYKATVSKIHWSALWQFHRQTPDWITVIVLTRVRYTLENSVVICLHSHQKRTRGNIHFALWQETVFVFKSGMSWKNDPTFHPYLNFTALLREIFLRWTWRDDRVL